MTIGAGASEPAAMRLVPIPDGELSLWDWGAGEPIVFIQTALTVDELRPLAEQPALEGFRKLLYHRRGYGASGPARRPGSVVADAADCRALLAAVGVERAHILGFSYSGAVAVQLAADAPECVQTVTLIEPPPVHVPNHADFRAANAELVEIRRTRGQDAALDFILTRAIGPDWRERTEAHLQDAAAQAERDAPTFFDTDLPALLAWEFTPDDAARVGCPVMHVGGTDSGPWFAEVRELVLDWFPQAEDVLLAGADHGMVLSHAAEVAGALAAFVHRHPTTAQL